jgi:hypothetical protein
VADVIVVGGGIAGVACARALADAGREVVVLDRGRRPGGRLGLRETGGHVVDIGASYVTSSDAGFSAVIDDWAARGLASPWTDTFHISDGSALTGTATGPVRWRAAAGLRGLVEDLARDLDVRFPVEVVSVRPDPAGGWLVHAEQGDALRAATVVLAMPDPQAERLLPEGASGLWAPEGPWPWEPVVSVSARWDRRWWADGVDGVFVHAATGPALIDWLADDGRRRGDAVPVLVVHSTADAAHKWLDDPDAAVGPVLEAAAAALGVTAPVPPPVWSHVQRWGYARPVRTRPAPPFALTPGGLGICGDAWGERPRVEGAWLSGTRLACAITGDR